MSGERITAAEVRMLAYRDAFAGFTAVGSALRHPDPWLTRLADQLDADEQRLAEVEAERDDFADRLTVAQEEDRLALWRWHREQLAATAREAYREGFCHGNDSAARYERGGGNQGVDYYWKDSETKARVTPTPEAPDV